MKTFSEEKLRNLHFKQQGQLCDDVVQEYDREDQHV